MADEHRQPRYLVAFLAAFGLLSLPQAIKLQQGGLTAPGEKSGTARSQSPTTREPSGDAVDPDCEDLKPLVDYFSDGGSSKPNSPADLKAAIDRYRTGKGGKAQPSIHCLLASLADPVGSVASARFDEYLDVVQRAVELQGSVLDRFSLPWKQKPHDDDPAAKVARARAGGKPLLDVEIEDKKPLRTVMDRPGVVLFRDAFPPEDDLHKPPSLVVVFVVPESPVSGLNKAAFRRALDLIDTYFYPLLTDEKPSARTSLSGRKVLHLLAPCFSGSQNSLETVVRSWASDEKRHGYHFRLISGSAHQIEEARLHGLFQDNDRHRLSFRSTVHKATVVRRKMLEYLRSSLGYVGDEIAILVESNTGLAQASIQNEQNMRIAALNLKQDSHYPAKGETPAEFIFPLQVTETRKAYANLGLLQGSKLATSGTPERLAIPPSEGSEVLDVPKAYTPASTAALDEMALTQVLTTISHRKYRAVGIVATNPLDISFLAHQIRAFCPNVRLFTIQSELLLSRPEEVPFLRGMLVASTYPLYPANQWMTACYPEASRVFFSDQGSQGLYNATVAHLWEMSMVESPAGPLLLEYGDPYNPNAFTSGRPPIWITAVGERGLYPVTYISDDTIHKASPSSDAAGAGETVTAEAPNYLYDPASAPEERKFPPTIANPDEATKAMQAYPHPLFWLLMLFLMFACVGVAGFTRLYAVWANSDKWVRRSKIGKLGFKTVLRFFNAEVADDVDQWPMIEVRPWWQIPEHESAQAGTIHVFPVVEKVRLRFVGAEGTTVQNREVDLNRPDAGSIHDLSRALEALSAMSQPRSLSAKEKTERKARLRTLLSVMGCANVPYDAETSVELRDLPLHVGADALAPDRNNVIVIVPGAAAARWRVFDSKGGAAVELNDAKQGAELIAAIRELIQHHPEQGTSGRQEARKTENLAAILTALGCEYRPNHRFGPETVNPSPPPEGADWYVLGINSLVCAVSYSAFVLWALATTPMLWAKPWLLIWFALLVPAASASAASFLYCALDLLNRHKDRFAPTVAWCTRHLAIAHVLRGVQRPLLIILLLMELGLVAALLAAATGFLGSVGLREVLEVAIAFALVIGALLVPLIAEPVRQGADRAVKSFDQGMKRPELSRLVFLALFGLFILLWIGFLSWLGISHSPNPSSRLEYERVTNLPSGLSPVFPYVFLTVALSVWAYAQLSRRQLYRLSYMPATPAKGLEATLPFEKILRELRSRRDTVNEIIIRPAKALGHVNRVLLWTVPLVGAMCVIRFLTRGRPRSYEGWIFDWCFWILFAVLFVMIILESLQLLGLWRNTRIMLRLAIDLPMPQAFNRIPGRLKRWFFGAEDFLSRKQLLLQQSAALQERSTEEVARIFTKLFPQPEGSDWESRRKTLVDVLNDPDAALDATREGVYPFLSVLWRAMPIEDMSRFASRENAPERDSVDWLRTWPLLPRLAATEPPSTRTSRPPANPRELELVRDWARTAEDLVALQIVRWFGPALSQFLPMMLFLVVGSISLLLAVSSYPFDQQGWLVTMAVSLILFVGAAISAVIIGINVDELISRVSDTTPGRLSLDSGFLSLVMTTIVPLLSALLAVSFDFSDILRTWVGPFLQLY